MGEKEAKKESVTDEGKGVDVISLLKSDYKPSLDQWKMVPVIYDIFLKNLGVYFKKFLSPDVEVSMSDFAIKDFSETSAIRTVDNLLISFDSEGLPGGGLFVISKEVFEVLFSAHFGTVYNEGRDADGNDKKESAKSNKEKPKDAKIEGSDEGGSRVLACQTSMGVDLCKKFANNILNCLASAFEVTMGVEMKVDSVLPSGDYGAGIYSEKDSMLFSVINFCSNNFSGEFYVMVTCSGFLSISDKIKNIVSSDTNRDFIEKWGELFAKGVDESALVLEAILGDLTFSVSEMLNLKEGSKIELGSAENSEIIMRVNGFDFCTGNVGNLGSNVAILVGNVL